MDNRLSDYEIKLTLFEQEKIKETLATEGARIIAEKALIIANSTIAKEAAADPFTNPGEISKNRQLRHLITTILPQIIEGIVNFEEDAPDFQVAPTERWTVKDCFWKT